jgi:hypothetical protein
MYEGRRNMKKLLILISPLVAGLLLFALVVPALAAPGGVTNPETLKELAAARRATKQYKNAELPTWRGVVDGYVQFLPDRVPGMGYHYARITLVDGVFNLAAPEVLIFEDEGSGRRLVAVEYIVVRGVGAGPPSGFTGADDGWEEPPAGAPLPPGTWTLHVWLWEENPNGIFAAFNPNIP